MKIYTGVLKFFDESRGSGLIALDHPYQKKNEVIFDIKDFNSVSKPDIGQNLTFKIKKNNNGIYATNIIHAEKDAGLLLTGIDDFHLGPARSDDSPLGTGTFMTCKKGPAECPAFGGVTGSDDPPGT